MAETRAGTVISNIAELRFPTAAGDRVVASNPVVLTTGERLDVTLSRSGTGTIDVPADGAAISFILTNNGNGEEAFMLSMTVSDASVAPRLIAIDTDGDGRFDPARDTLVPAGLTPVVAPGAILPLLVVIEPAAAAVTATSLSVTATAVTATAVTAVNGSRAAGTSYAGQGDGGGDAVAGATGATATARVPLGGAPMAPTLVKTQNVHAPDGSATPTRDAIVTYALAARFGGPANAVRLADPIPAGTRYIPGSLTLDGAALSDAADADAGSADAGGIAVKLGDVGAAATRTVTFQVKIQ